MKILRIVLILAGLATLVLGVYSRFIIEGPLVFNGEPWFSQEGYENQAMGMIGLGILAILAGLFMRRRR